MKKVRVLLIDDHSLFMEGLNALLSHYEDVEVCGQMPSGTRAIEWLDEYGEVDIIFTDLEMPDLNGIITCREIQKRFPSLPIVLLSHYKKQELIKGARTAGARGYLSKDSEIEDYYDAIQQIMDGKDYYPLYIQQESDKSLELRPREVEILTLITQGYNVDQMSKILFWKPATIEKFRNSLLQKLDAKNNGQLQEMGSKLGLAGNGS